MTTDQVLRRTAEQCRQLALRVRTDAAREELLRLADEFEARIEQAGAEEECDTQLARQAAN
jgi:hypothetical protein